MNKWKIENTNGQWFDKDQAERFNGNYDHNATRGTDLFRTKTGKWVHYYWTRWQGETCTCELISSEMAMNWLLENEHFNTVEEYFPGTLAQKEV